MIPASKNLEESTTLTTSAGGATSSGAERSTAVWRCWRGLLGDPTTCWASTTTAWRCWRRSRRLYHALPLGRRTGGLRNARAWDDNTAARGEARVTRYQERRHHEGSGGVIVYAINKASNERLRVAMLLHPISTPGQIEEYHGAAGRNPQTFYTSFSNEVLEAAFNTPWDKLGGYLGARGRGNHKDNRGSDQSIE
ncbi:unnamed protein product [Musa acuminata var. zebrina]